MLYRTARKVQKKRLCPLIAQFLGPSGTAYNENEFYVKSHFVSYRPLNFI